MAYAQASKLTASWSGYSEPATHAVPLDSRPANATAICGVAELVVHTEYRGPERFDPVEFDPNSAYSCKRCVKKVRAAS